MKFEMIYWGKIWVRLGCNKTSLGLLRAPEVAIGAVKLQLVTAKTPVTAEVASSSLVVPAIHSKTLNRFQGIGFMGAKRCNSDSALSVRRRKSLKAQRLELPAWRA